MTSDTIAFAGYWQSHSPLSSAVAVLVPTALTPAANPLARRGNSENVSEAQSREAEMRPSEPTLMLLAAGALGRLGIGMRSPQTAPMNSAPPKPQSA